MNATPDVILVDARPLRELLRYHYPVPTAGLSVVDGRAVRQRWACWACSEPLPDASSDCHVAAGVAAALAGPGWSLADAGDLLP